MLQSIRDRVTGPAAILVLGAIAIVFAFWGTEFGSKQANYAAQIDGEKISTQTVRRAWQQRQSQLQQMIQGELPPDMVKSQQDALLDQFVRQTLLTQRAREFGYRVSDEALARRVTEVPQFQVDGKFSKDRYFATLRAAGLTETQFESELHTELLVDQVSNAVVQSAFVTPAELERLYAIEKQQREVDYALIPADAFAGSVSVTDEQIQQWYDANQDKFLLPETVDLQYIELDRARAESGVQVTEQGLKDYYEQMKDRFVSQERRHARHILITSGEGVDDAAAQKKAAELTAQAKGGADFAQLAKDNSRDPGSAAQGGDLGWAERGMFVGPFEEALFSMQPGEIRGPVKTQFGYHVLKLEAVEPGKAKSFDEVRAEVEQEFRKERSESAFYDETQKLGDLSFASLTELDSAAKAMNLPIKTVKGFTHEGGGGDLGQDPNVIEAAFSEDVLDRRQNSPLVTIGEDRALVLRVTDHKPAEPRPLAEVRSQIEAQIKTQLEREAAAKKGAEAVARLQKGEPWADVARSAGLTAVGKRFITRQDTIAPSAVVRGAFGAPRGEITEAKPYIGGITTDDGNYAVYAVTQVRSGDPAGESQTEQQARRRRTEAMLGNEDFSNYLADAERKAKIYKNDKVFE